MRGGAGAGAGAGGCAEVQEQVQVQVQVQVQDLSAAPRGCLSALKCWRLPNDWMAVQVTSPIQ